MRVRDAEDRIRQQAQVGVVANRAWAYQSLGRACFQLDDIDEAARCAELAVKWSSTFGYQGFAPHAQLLLGDIATHPDRFSAHAGEAHYQQALSLAEPLGMRPLIAHCHLGFGRLYSRIGKHHEAQEHFTVARTMYGAMDMAFWLTQVEQEMTA